MSFARGRSSSPVPTASGSSTGRGDMDPRRLADILDAMAHSEGLAKVSGDIPDLTPAALRMALKEASHLLLQMVDSSRAPQPGARSLILHIDGAARGNPGPAGVGGGLWGGGGGFRGGDVRGEGDCLCCTSMGRPGAIRDRPGSGWCSGTKRVISGRSTRRMSGMQPTTWPNTRPYSLDCARPASWEIGRA